MLFAASAPRPPIQGHSRSREQVSIFEYSLAVGPHRLPLGRDRDRRIARGLSARTGFQHRLTGFAMLL